MMEKIKKYWDERAKQYPDSPSATTEDIYLRELEISNISQTIHQLSIAKHGRVLDIGCGDGYTTLNVAHSIRDLFFLGVDYSEYMINNACKRLEAYPHLKHRVAFAVGDVRQLGKVCGDEVYDIVLSARCLINLASVESQSHAIAEIAKHTKPGGYYIAIENFVEGHERMNKARCAVGLPEIPIRWHNLYLKECEFVSSVSRFFEIIMFKDFSSSYYFATRVIYSRMCQMREEAPDYNHEIHQLAVNLPWVGQFSPIRMAVLRNKWSGGLEGVEKYV